VINGGRLARAPRAATPPTSVMKSRRFVRRHQAHLMAELRQFACPIVRCGTGFHADQARRQSLEERHHLAGAELLPDDDLLGRINAVNLEHVLGEIQTNRGDLHVDGSLM
jgi:hypothetical protein